MIYKKENFDECLFRRLEELLQKKGKVLRQNVSE